MSATYVKRAEGVAAVARLHREADVLRRVAQPGVVEVVGHRFGPNTGELLLAAVDGVTLRHYPFHNATEIAALFAGLAATLAHVHEQGVAHTRLSLDSVLISALDHRPVITGFGDAIILDEEWSGAAADDVADLGKMLQDKLIAPVDLLRNRLADEDESNDQVGSTNLHQALSAIASLAAEDDPSKRPSARRMATLLRNAARPPSPQRPSRKPKPILESLFTAERLAAALGVGLLLAAVAGLVALTDPRAKEKKPVISPLALATAPTCPRVNIAGSLVADIDGDGCGDAIRISQGIVSVNSERYTVGQPNDIVVLGRWNCSSAPTLALLRPDSGHVFVFNEWPAINGETTPDLAGTVRGAKSIRPVLGSDGCDVIEVIDDRGRATTIDPGSTEGAR